MDFDREAAKADGFTDEEIDAFIRGQLGTQVPTLEQPSRAAEVAATGLMAAPDVIGGAAKTAALGYGAYKTAQVAPKIYEAVKNRMTPPPMPGSPDYPIGSPKPVAPSTVPAPKAQAPQPTAMQKGMEIASKMREIAAGKVFQNAMKGGLGAAAALTPGNIGQRYNFPTTGPFAGQEINPQTGRPWTEQELAQYR